MNHRDIETNGRSSTRDSPKQTRVGGLQKGGVSKAIWLYGKLDDVPVTSMEEDPLDEELEDLEDPDIDDIEPEDIIDPSDEPEPEDM